MKVNQTTKTGLALGCLLVVLAGCKPDPNEDPKPCRVLDKVGLHLAEPETDPCAGAEDVHFAHYSDEDITSTPISFNWEKDGDEQMTSMVKYRHQYFDDDGEDIVYLRPGNSEEGNCGVAALFFASYLNGAVQFESEEDFNFQLADHLKANGYNGALHLSSEGLVGQSGDYWDFLDQSGVSLGLNSVDDVPIDSAFVGFVTVKSEGDRYDVYRSDSSPNHAITLLKQGEDRYLAYDPNLKETLVVNQAFVDRYVNPGVIIPRSSN